AGVQILHYERYRPWYLVPMGIVKEMKRPGDLFAHYPVRGFQQGIGTYYTGFTPQELYRVPSCLSRPLIGEDELREQLLLEQLKQTRKAHGRWGLFFFRWKDDHCWEEFGQYFYDRIRPHLGPPHHVFESERAHLLYFSSESRELASSPGRR